MQFSGKSDRIWHMFKFCGSEIKGAIFDLDGTLIDSMEIWREIDEDFFSARGMEVPENYQENISHLGFREVAAFTVRNYLQNEKEEDLIAEWGEMCRAKYSARDSAKYFKSGAIELLKRFYEEGLKLSVATASSPDFFLPILRSGGVENLFDNITTVDEVKKDKSHPDIFLRCAEKMELKTKECIVFEDNIFAVRAAKAAGMKTVAIFDKISEKQVNELKEISDLFLYDFRDCALWKQ